MLCAVSVIVESAIELAVVLLLLCLTYLIILPAVLFSDNPRTCCDADQVYTLNTNMKIPREVNNPLVLVMGKS